MIHGTSTFIHVGQIHIDTAPASISTVLGSCVAVCLFDRALGIGGMNHYLLPFWNGNGLQSAKFGNISIPKLVELMLTQGSSSRSIEAKIFGGAAMHSGGSDLMRIGQKNILVAKEILSDYRIPVIAEDVGGTMGRKIQLDLANGKVLLKYTVSNQEKKE